VTEQNIQFSIKDKQVELKFTSQPEEYIYKRVEFCLTMPRPPHARSLTSRACCERGFESPLPLIRVIAGVLFLSFDLTLGISDVYSIHPKKIVQVKLIQYQPTVNSINIYITN
jgi:hypothetical protein